MSVMPIQVWGPVSDLNSVRPFLGSPIDCCSNFIIIDLFKNRPVREALA